MEVECRVHVAGMSVIWQKKWKRGSQVMTSLLPSDLEVCHLNGS